MNLPIGRDCEFEHQRRERQSIRVDIGPLQAIPLGQGRAYRVGARTIAVFRQRDGQLFATDNTCPHRGGPLAEGLIGGGTLLCPLHGWKFDLRTGRCLGEDACLPTYPVEVVDGRVLVTLAEAT